MTEECASSSQLSPGGKGEGGGGGDISAGTFLFAPQMRKKVESPGTEPAMFPGAVPPRWR